jgi:type II secretory pathway pseudopilin PulG
MSLGLRKSEGGTTLTELLVAMGLLSLLGLGAAQVVERLARGEVSMRALTTTQNEMKNFIKLIQRDLDYRTLSPASTLCNSNLCTGFSVNRSAISGTGSYRVQYTSSCASWPAGLTAPAGIRFDQFTAAQSNCIRLLNCAPGNYPRATIRVSNISAGATVPLYPAQLPLLAATRSLAANPVATAVCAVRSQTSGPYLHDRVIVESGYLNAEGVLTLQREEINITSKSTNATAIMLPQ